MNFGVIILNQSISKIQNYSTWIKIALLFILKLKMFMRTLQADDVEKRFDTSNYEVNSPLSTGKNKKVIGLMKDELWGKIMIEFVALRLKIYS